ncbi:small nuclear ribonucleoprotein G-like [Sorex araneus]|uniref:small nuclear ribonucleoprotein G-like n=1 Tax=Sorex araneus TaxID=42254 RepID=UPI0024338E34|nr:small nuclear ribonucleoprotein G-like [Sorex araneus]
MGQKPEWDEQRVPGMLQLGVRMRCASIPILRRSRIKTGLPGAKSLSLKLNGGRHIQGIQRGFYPFVIDECVEMATSGQQNNAEVKGIRGSSITMLAALEQG